MPKFLPTKGGFRIKPPCRLPSFQSPEQGLAEKQDRPSCTLVFIPLAAATNYNHKFTLLQSGGQKSKMSLTGLNQGVRISSGTWENVLGENPLLYFFQFPEATFILWWWLLPSSKLAMTA